MLERVEWIFFDVGSTLINERKVYEHRMRDMAEATNRAFEQIYDMAISFYKENKKGDLEVAKLLGLPKQKCILMKRFYMKMQYPVLNS